jgi:REP element-mobilizing transposase RayT
MPVHKQVTNAGIYFITFTNYQWLWLLEKTKGYDLVYKWFDVLSTKQHAINGFVIMPNHLHLLLYYAGGGQSLNTIVGNGKRFMPA